MAKKSRSRGTDKDAGASAGDDAATAADGGGGSTDASGGDGGVRPAFVPRDVTLVHLWQIQIVRDAVMIGAIVATLWLGYALRAVTVPLLVALLLAYLFEPLVERWSRRPKVSRTVAVSVLLSFALLVLVLFTAVALPLVVGQTTQLVRDVSSGRTRTSIARLEQWVPADYRDEFRLFLDQLPMGDGPLPPPVGEEASGEDAAAPGAADGAGGADDTGDDAPVEDGDAATASAGGDADGAATGAAADGAAGGTDAASADSGSGRLDEDTVVALVEQRVEQILAEREAARIAAEAITTDAGASADDGVGGDVVSIVQRSIRTVTGILGFVVQVGLLAFLIPFYFFFFSVSFPKIVEFGRAMLPSANRERTLELLDKMDHVIAGFVRGRIVICGIMGVLFAFGWLVVGVPYALPLGIVVGVFSAVPYLGGVGLPLAVGLLLFEQLATPPDERMAIWLVFVLPTAVFAIVQLIEGYVLIPAIAGKATDLDPVTIVVAVLAGGSVLGVYGMLLAIPAAACAKIMMKEVLLPHLRAWLEGRSRDPLPIGRGGAGDGKEASKD